MAQAQAAPAVSRHADQLDPGECAAVCTDVCTAACCVAADRCVACTAVLAEARAARRDALLHRIRGPRRPHGPRARGVRS